VDNPHLNIARACNNRAKRRLRSDKLATTHIIQLPHLSGDEARRIAANVAKLLERKS
jgi:hypothetical protein